MGDGSLTITLDRTAFEPGETLCGSYRLLRSAPSRLEEVEIAVGWHTEGKGIAARGVAHREVQRPEDGVLDADGRGTFSTVLPASPLSYEGELIQIRWTVRVRAWSPSWEDLHAEEEFRLGHVVAVADGASA